MNGKQLFTEKQKINLSWLNKHEDIWAHTQPPTALQGLWFCDGHCNWQPSLSIETDSMSKEIPAQYLWIKSLLWDSLLRETLKLPFFSWLTKNRHEALPRDITTSSAMRFLHIQKVTPWNTIKNGKKHCSTHQLTVFKSIFHIYSFDLHRFFLLVHFWYRVGL